MNTFSKYADIYLTQYGDQHRMYTVMTVSTSRVTFRWERFLSLDLFFGPTVWSFLITVLRFEEMGDWIELAKLIIEDRRMNSTGTHLDSKTRGWGLMATQSLRWVSREWMLNLLQRLHLSLVPIKYCMTFDSIPDISQLCWLRVEQQEKKRRKWI